MTGLLDDFDESMSGLSDDDVATANFQDRTARARGTAADGPGRADAAGDGADVPDSPGPATSALQAFEREIDERALSIAARLLGVALPEQVDESAATGCTLTLQVARSVERATIGVEHSGPVLVGRAGAEVADAVAAGETRLSIDLGVVSRRHCAISQVEGNVVVIDLGSANGTFVGRGSTVHQVTSEPFVLQAGDVISTAGGAAPMVTVEEATP